MHAEQAGVHPTRERERHPEASEDMRAHITSHIQYQTQMLEAEPKR